MSSEIEKRAASLAAWPLAAAALVIAIPFFEIGPDSPIFTFGYWGGDSEGKNFNRMEVIRNFALIVGGFLGLWLAWRRIVLMDQQTTVALQDSKQKEMDHVAARFERAVELLGSDELRFQQFAVSRINTISKAWPAEYSAAAISLLAGQLRIVAAASRRRRDPEGFPTNFVNETVVYLFDHIERCAVERIYYPEVELTDIVLEQPYISNLIVTPQTFKGSELRQADFENCSFEGRFEPDDFRCTGAVFTNCAFDRAEFIGSNFMQTGFFGCEIYMGIWVGCDMTGAAFRDVLFQKNRPVFYRCIMNNVDFCVTESFGQNISGVHLTSSNFEDCLVSSPDQLPTGLDEYDPPMDPVLTGEQDENGRKFDVRVVESIDDDE